MARCPECGSSKIGVDLQRGERICQDCGLVLEENMVDPGQEWRCYTTDEWNKNTRCGPPSTFVFHDKNRGASIGCDRFDVYGKCLSNETNRTMRRLRRLNNRSRVNGTEDKRTIETINNVQKISSSLNLPKTMVESCAQLCHALSGVRRGRGKSNNLIASAIVYVVCRSCGLPRTFKEIAIAGGNDQIDIFHAYKTIKPLIDVKIPPIKSNAYVHRFCSRLDLNELINTKVIDILMRVDDDFNGSPVTITAGAIYYASRLNGSTITQRDVALVTGVSVVSVRTACNFIKKRLGQDEKEDIPLDSFTL